MKRTLREVYYGINAAIISYLDSQNIQVGFYKYGIDPATMKTDLLNTINIRYPYIQSSISNIKRQSWTSKRSGIYTVFDYQLSFFAAPPSEAVNDSKYFYHFDVVKDAMADIELDLLTGLSSIQSTTELSNFEVKSGVSVPSEVAIYRMSSVCSYRADVPDPGLSTDIDSGIVLEAV